MNLKHKNIMKKNIIRAALFAVFAFVAGYGVYTSQKETSMSDLAMENVEALAIGEVYPEFLCVGTNAICHIYAPGDEVDGVKVRW